MPVYDLDDPQQAAALKAETGRVARLRHAAGLGSRVERQVYIAEVEAEHGADEAEALRQGLLRLWKMRGAKK